MVQSGEPKQLPVVYLVGETLELKHPKVVGIHGGRLLEKKLREKL